MRALLAAEPFVGRVEILASTVSTNDDARRLADEGAPEGTIVVAERQTAGRGRAGRTWSSPAGLGLYVSVVLHPREAPQHLTRWTLAAALAACEACRSVSGADVRIKWPNDLIVERRKLAGILAEARVRDGRAELIVGTGINVHQTLEDFPADLRDSATSLDLAAPRARVDRETLAAAYVGALASTAATMRDEGWPAVATRWEALAVGVRGTRVEVLSAQGDCREGVTRGIDPVGALLVERPDGDTLRVHGADAVRWPRLEQPPGS